MMNIGGAIPNTMTRVKKLAPGQSLELLTYKRDRGILILRTDQGCTVTETGFNNETFHTDMTGLKKLLKTLFKREFPRSNKIIVRVLNEKAA